MSPHFQDDGTLPGDTSRADSLFPIQTAAARYTAAHVPLGIAWLETTDGGRFPIQSSCTLGRSPSNHVSLPGEKVSRHHALIEARDENEFWLSDLGSMNGTWLNDRRVCQLAQLADGDQIAVGPHRLAFRQPAGRGRSRAESSIPGERCWLVLAHLDSGTRVEQALPPDRIPSAVGGWMDRCREIFEDHFGTLDRYLGDGLLAYWRAETPNHAVLADALMTLKKLQQHSQPTFRFVAHCGEVVMGRAAQADAKPLSGPAVHFVFRLDKLAAGLRVPNLVSGAVQAALDSRITFHEVGRHAVDGTEEGSLLFQF